MEFEFDEARNGNVALTGELDLSNTREFTIGIAFGETLSSTVSGLFQSLGHRLQGASPAIHSSMGSGGERSNGAPKVQWRQGTAFRIEL